MAEHEHEGMTAIAGGTRGAVPTFVATPSEAGPWPGVVIVHDGLGMGRRPAQPGAVAGRLRLPGCRARLGTLGRPASVPVPDDARLRGRA
jgi:hypothetical protein